METKAFFDFDLDEAGEPVESFRVLDVNQKGTMNSILTSSIGTIAQGTNALFPALKLAFFHMRTNAELLDGSRGSVVLTSSTAGYFGGTGVVAYVSSKHGVIGLLRLSKRTANGLGIRLNAVAPTLTPTYMMSVYSEARLVAGLPANEPQDVATAII